MLVPIHDAMMCSCSLTLLFRFGVVEIFEILFWCVVNYPKNQKGWSPIVVTQTRLTTTTSELRAQLGAGVPGLRR